VTVMDPFYWSAAVPVQEAPAEQAPSEDVAAPSTVPAGLLPDPFYWARRQARALLKRKRLREDRQGNSAFHGQKKKRSNHGWTRGKKLARQEPQRQDRQRGRAAANSSAHLQRSSGRERRSIRSRSSLRGDSDTGDVSGWVQCDQCSKWRRLEHRRGRRSAVMEPWTGFFCCSMASWDPEHASCTAPQARNVSADGTTSEPPDGSGDGVGPSGTSSVGGRRGGRHAPCHAHLPARRPREREPIRRREKSDGVEEEVDTFLSGDTMDAALQAASVVCR
jgi:hypothetical protein